MQRNFIVMLFFVINSRLDINFISNEMVHKVAI